MFKQSLHHLWMHSLPGWTAASKLDPIYIVFEVTYGAGLAPGRRMFGFAMRIEGSGQNYALPVPPPRPEPRCVAGARGESCAARIAVEDVLGQRPVDETLPVGAPGQH